MKMVQFSEQFVQLRFCMRRRTILFRPMVYYSRHLRSKIHNHAPKMLQRVQIILFRLVCIRAGRQVDSLFYRRTCKFDMMFVRALKERYSLQSPGSWTICTAARNYCRARQELNLPLSPKLLDLFLNHMHPTDFSYTKSHILPIPWGVFVVSQDSDQEQIDDNRHICLLNPF